MPGPVPKHPSQRRRRNMEPSVRRLPAACDRPVPRWPAGLSKASAAELAYWRELWALPVANWWHAQCISPRVVQRYVRSWRRYSEGVQEFGARADRLERDLGLTPEAMAKLRLEVEADELAERRQEPVRPVRRVRAVDPDAVAGA